MVVCCSTNAIFGDLYRPLATFRAREVLLENPSHVSDFQTN